MLFKKVDIKELQMLSSLSSMLTHIPVVVVVIIYSIYAIVYIVCLSLAPPFIQRPRPRNAGDLHAFHAEALIHTSIGAGALDSCGSRSSVQARDVSFTYSPIAANSVLYTRNREEQRLRSIRELHLLRLKSIQPVWCITRISSASVFMLLRAL